MSTIMQETTTTATTTDGPTVDVLALTTQERCAEFARFRHLKDGLYHLSSIKEIAGIGSRDTHITLDQVKALHRGLSRIVDGLDKPASHGPMWAEFFRYGKRSVAELASDAGVDADALQRHLDGEGPMSRIAYDRVLNAQVGGKAAKA
jgi:hypothetical protein